MCNNQLKYNWKIKKICCGKTEIREKDAGRIPIFPVMKTDRKEIETALWKFAAVL